MGDDTVGVVHSSVVSGMFDAKECDLVPIDDSTAEDDELDGCVMSGTSRSRSRSEVMMMEACC
jgi:hypothetical protein